MSIFIVQLSENNSTLFTINGKTLKFVSLDFYNGIYKEKTAAIQLINDLNNDTLDNNTLKRGIYIFNWLNEIINSIQIELDDPELENVEIIVFKKHVPLFELSACAGGGFYSDGPSKSECQVECPFENADFAVNISGKSMQPTIMDKSRVFVEATTVLSDGDIGIFVVDGEVMCKRYRKDEDRVWLQPDNFDEYNSIELNEHINCLVQGKVLI